MGAFEPVDVNKIVPAVQRSSYDLSHVDAIRVASKTIGGLYDGATTRELDTISIDTAASLIAEEPQYSRLAARLLLATIVKEVSALNLHSFSQAIAYGHQEGVVSKATAEFVQTHANDSPLVEKSLGFAPNRFRKAADYRHDGDP